jgi:hypothetical protein
LYGRTPGATIGFEEPTMQDVQNLADTIESLSARIVAIRDSL